MFIKTESTIESWLEELPARVVRHFQQTGRPLVTLSYAQSLDGSIAARRGQPLALSGEAAMRLTHQLRARHAAILVGIGTVLADDPQLTVRLAQGDSPRPVVLDSRLRMPLTARLLERSENLPWIFCSFTASPKRGAVLVARGARVEPVAPDVSGGLNLRAVLDRLAALGITSLMVEGGAHVIRAFLAQGLVDEVLITTAPVWVGGLRALDGGPEELGGHKEYGGPEKQGGLGEPGTLEGQGGFPALAEPHYSQLGPDLITWGSLVMRAQGG